MPSTAIARALLTGALTLTASAILPHAAHASSDYPSQPITIVVPQPAGGAADQFARPFGQALGKALGQSVIILNRPGANGNIAAANVAHITPADGYTIFYGSVSTLAVNPHLYKDAGFDPVKDFQPLTLTNQTPNVLLVGAQTPYRSVADVVAAARAKPGSLAFGSAGNGNTMHLVGLQFQAKAGVQLMHIPYKGGPAALNDVLAGQIPMMFHNLSAVIPFHQSGKVRVLAVADTKRSPLLPDVPTMAEVGLTGVESVAWSGMLVRSGTPAPIVEKLNAAMRKILDDPAFRKPLEAQGFEILSSSPDDFTVRLKKDYQSMGDVIRAGNVHID
ncbi:MULTISPECIES: tripartite tricarboxylate transporter substrate binding protein [unclassified Achromobacter]|uniref:Bug family tripartite tricarboxylate transporter substrate binding protein n=1 Tax=unclassified Achromobacter TaxID=2626865 RepID=UPI000B516BF2|nr:MULTISPECIES: tripartite tricarboxylate transporter substrate binding protein [unclassified Achromobacter]OWT67951.1 MFS transporter [Achromobacter sp. HZ28]OWT81009.1 MFS transporter [Achromobacter sp. HZ34]